jgi:hypothetical protein
LHWHRLYFVGAIHNCADRDFDAVGERLESHMAKRDGVLASHKLREREATFRVSHRVERRAPSLHENIRLGQRVIERIAIDAARLRPCLRTNVTHCNRRQCEYGKRTEPCAA